MSNWLAYSPTSGVGNGTITLTAETLSELEDRVATLVAKSQTPSDLSATTVVLQMGAPTGLSEYLTFEIISGGTIYWKKSNSSADTLDIQYSKDSGTTWVNISSTTSGTPISVQTGDVVLFKGDNAAYGNGKGNSFANGDGLKMNVKGNIMSLTDSLFFSTARTVNERAFAYLFSGNTAIISAENLLLPATTLANSCYTMMFYNCTSLTTAPSILPANVLANNCYSYMFYRCSSLTTAPALPATELAPSCYYDMFANCSGLTTAPELPATTLANECYSLMFYECYSLTTAPELPATTLANRCYGGMFNGCTGLTSAPELPATALTYYCYSNMFRDCTSLTTAPELSATTLAEGCYQYMFQGCSSLTTAPELRINNTINRCFQYMFRNCTSLTTAPLIEATGLTDDSCVGMFEGCTSLNYIKCTAIYIGTYAVVDYPSTYGWVDGVAATGTFVKNPNMSSWTTGKDGIPIGWTVINA